MDASEKPSALLHKIGIGKGLQFQKPRTPSTVFVTLDPASFEQNNNNNANKSNNIRKRKAFEVEHVENEEREHHHHSVIKNLRIEFVDESGDLQSLSGSGGTVKIKEKEVSKEERTSSGGIWNTETHLYLWHRARHCINIFADSSLTRVNLAITDELNLHHFLGRDITDPTPLDFSLTVAICVGAAAVGDRALENEYWMQARHQAGSLFDLTEFNVAAALQHLSEYALHSGRQAEGIYYATAGVSICERLGKQHTGVYLWLLISSLLGSEPGAFWSKLPAVRNIPVFDEEGQEEEEEKEETKRTRKGQEKIKELSSEDEDSYDAIEKRQARKRKRQQRDEDNNEDEDEDDEGNTALDALCTELVMHVSGSYAQAMTNLDNPSLLKALDGVLESLRRQWELVRHVFTRGQRLGMDVGLSAVMTAIKQARGRTNEALASALIFTEHAQDPLFPYMLVLKEGTYHPLKVLLDTGNVLILHSLLNILQHKNGGTFLDGVLEDFKPFLQIHNS